MEGCGILANTQEKKCIIIVKYERSHYFVEENTCLLNAQCHGMSDHGILILLFQVCLLSFLLFQK